MYNDKNSGQDISSNGAPLPLDIDLQKYKAELADTGITNAQADVLLRTLHDIMSSFVRLGFDLAEIDLCGQLFEGLNDLAAPEGDAVNSPHTNPTEHERAQNGDDDGH